MAENERLTEAELAEMRSFMAGELRMPYQKGEVCIHGHLKRSCDTCQAQWEVSVMEPRLPALLAASTLVYIGRSHLASLGRGDREEFLKEQLSPGRIAAGAIRYAGWTTFMPDIVDTFMPAGERLFDTRYSGLSSSLLSVDRAPVPALIARAATTPAELFDSIVAGEFSKQDLRAISNITPGATHFPVRNLIDAFGDRLPDEEDR